MYNISRLSCQALRLASGVPNDFGQLGMSTESITFLQKSYETPVRSSASVHSHMSPRPDKIGIQSNWGFRGDLIMFAIYIPPRWDFGL